jgi:hypothetical protein
MDLFEIVVTIVQMAILIVIWGIIFGLAGLIFGRLSFEIIGKAVVLIAGFFGEIYLTVLALSSFGAVYSTTAFIKFLFFLIVVGVAYLIVATSIRRCRPTWRWRDLKQEFLPQ